MKLVHIHLICNGSGDQFRDGDILGQYSFGAKRINLWHGNGNKRTGWMSNGHIESMRNKNMRNTIYKWLNMNSFLYRTFCVLPGGWDNKYLVSTSLMMKEVFMK